MKTGGFFLALAALASILATEARAAVVYRPIGQTFNFPLWNSPSPTTLVPLDWNGDGIPELNLRLRNDGQFIGPDRSGFMISAELVDSTAEGAIDAAYLISSQSPYPIAPAVLMVGEDIDHTKSFSDAYYNGRLFTGEYYSIAQGAATPTIGNVRTLKSLRYVGVNLAIDSESRYGWVGMRFEADNFFATFPNVSISAFAYEDSGQSIAAGQIAAKLSADFNDDGVVNAADLAVWNLSDGGAAADADDDGDSDGADLLVWQQQLGQRWMATAASATATGVPEPTTGTLTAASAIALLHSCRKKPRE